MKRPALFWPLAEAICRVSDFLASPPTKTGECNCAAGPRGFLHLHIRGMLVPETPLCLTGGSVYNEKGVSRNGEKLDVLAVTLLGESLSRARSDGRGRKDGSSYLGQVPATTARVRTALLSPEPQAPASGAARWAEGSALPCPAPCRAPSPGAAPRVPALQRFLNGSAFLLMNSYFALHMFTRFINIS